ncbi:MAG: hypothetical protein WD048_06640 [Chitinophagales bacterium]
MRKYIGLLLLAFIVLSLPACKAKKEAAAKAAAEAEALQKKTDKARSTLQSMLDSDDMSSAEMEEKLNEIKSWNLDDAEVNRLIPLVEDKIEQVKIREKEEARERKKEANKKAVIDKFRAIANAGSASEANKHIDQAINLFESPDAPILLIIKITGDVVDYDRPTTAKRYLNYVKDQKTFTSNIHSVEFNEEGEIIELVLKK